MQKVLFVGLDVHKVSISVTVVEDGREGAISDEARPIRGIILQFPLAFTCWSIWRLGLHRRPSQDLEWYDAYNAVKHDRENSFERATLALCRSERLVSDKFRFQRRENHRRG
ncbi:hypothetical protein [Bradyrhizobium erythrophlei]|uniref:hypothetical protein n=1 Tax=Bradyrhizobium erythrophlei TaxID=1437360 RepID=UPI00115F8B76|nr:hypothetical protein [Bradyrhizobium erythrophlei]